MRRILNSLLILVLVLLVPILPFLWFSEPIYEWTKRWSEQPPSRPVTAVLIVGLLSTDVVLPVPSSLVSTIGGSQLGTLGGTCASWLGMSLGAALGFAVARRWGRPLAARLAKAEDLDRLDALARRYAAALLVVTRAVPVLAEAAVLLVGLHGVTWRKFWPPVLLANLGIALAYSFFGHLAEKHHWLPAALGISLALPLLLAAVARWWLRKREAAEHQPATPVANSDDDPNK
jgi:uncharacterized membrane protein YdjX (TVP38/TMEM64 family)